MQFPIVREYKTDIRNNNLENEKRQEPFSVEAGVWTRVIVPRHSPFFVESLKLYFPNGQPMVPNVHYRIFRLMAKLTELTGSQVAATVELLDPNITEGFIDYDVVGEFSLFDNTLLNMIMTAKTDDRPIKWENISNKLVVFPPKLHQHSLLYDVVAFQDLIDLLNLISRIVDENGASIIQVRLSHYLTLLNRYMLVYRSMLLKYLDDHKASYNSHGLNAKQMGLEKVDNFATASTPEELSSDRDDLHLTVNGLRAMISTPTSGEGAFLLDGRLPISQYGGESYIPPSIDGSFEGLGSNSSASAMCLEENDILMMLTPHNDGRNEGLYYSQMNGFSKAVPKITYTAYKYGPPSLVSRGFNPTAVVGGSNHRVIMVGDPKLSRWFIAASNGTLDANFHSFIELDMSIVNAKIPAAYHDNDTRMAVHVIGNYVVLVVSTGSGSVDSHMFFRIPLTALKGTATAKWTQLLVTYKNYDNVQFTGVENYTPFQPVSAVGGGYSKYGPTTFRQPAATINKNGRTMTLSCPKPGVATTGYLFFAVGVVAGTFKDGLSLLIPLTLGMTYELNADTGVLTEVSRNPAFSVGFTDTTLTERNAYQNLHFPYCYYGTVNETTATAVILDNGKIVIATSNAGNRFPAIVMKTSYLNRVSAADVMSRPMDVIASPREYSRGIEAVVNSPLLSGTFPTSLTYEADGELYSAIDQPTNTRKTYFRAVDGPYDVRPEVTNLYVDSVPSRALTNTVYTTNMDYTETPIGISGSTAELTAGGVECGSTSFASMGYSSMGAAHQYPRAAAFLAPSSNNVLLSCPRTYRRVLDDVAQKATYSAETFYGARQGLVDKFKGLIPSEFVDYTPWSVCFHILGNEAGGMFKGLNLGLGVIAFHDKVKGVSRQIFVLFTPVVEAPNSNHPDVHLITDAVILDVSDAIRSGVNVRLPEQQLAGLGGNRCKGGVYIYRDGNRLSVYTVNPYTTNTNSTIYTRQTGYFEVNLTSKKLENTYAYMTNWQTADLCAPIPKLGMSDVRLLGSTSEDSVIAQAGVGAFDYTGGAARLLHRTAPDDSLQWVMGPTVYPETGWTIFFQMETNAVFNGKSSVLQPGMIDLRDVDPYPANKTFYVYAVLKGRIPVYEVTLEKRLESPFQVWVATVVTNHRQILTIERFNVTTLNGHRISERKGGNCIPASSGLVGTEGKAPWIRSNELLP